MNEAVRKSAWLAAVVIVIAIAGFAFASTVTTLSAAGASVAVGTHAPATPSAVNYGPLTKVAGSASNLNPVGLTSLGTVSVLPEPTKYNAKAGISVTVTLSPSQSLQTLINEINDVGSPLYRHFLSAQTLGAEYGNAQYASTVAYFESYGLTVQISATSLTLDVSGTVAQMSAAFHTTLTAFATQYQSTGIWNPSFGNSSGVAGTTVTGPAFYANEGPAELPAGIASAVNGIAGLDGMTATPTLNLPLGFYPGMVPEVTGSGNNSTPPPSPTPCVFGVFGSCPQSLDGNQSINDSNFLWTDFGPSGYTCEDYELCGDYQFMFPSTVPDIAGADSLWSGADTIDSEPDSGQGITIAVVEVGCAVPSDLSQFSQMVYGNPNQLPDRVTQIAINTSGGYSLFNLSNTNIDNCILEGELAGWTGETELDVEYASTMAPSAHIDVIAIPYPGYFSDFATAYADIAQYLALGSTGGVCPSTTTLTTANMYVVAGSTAGACGVTITSNSYGEGEEYEYFYGTPIYITAQDQELELLNSVGVTNFFASGDGGGTYATVNDFSPAESPGATSVGGAQITASGDGSEFPITSNNFTYCDGYEEVYNSTTTYCFGALGQAYWAKASGIGNTAYWSYSEHVGATYTGVVGGGFGQSFVETQPWWQNALDTYSTGAKIDPVISGTAAFNMSIYVFGGWELFYGGTSFATPIQAGEWALVEEQANVAFGTPEMGDINPLLYAAHNAFEAGAIAANPYTPMGQYLGLDSAPVNSFTWYYYNLSIEVPSAPIQPIWFASLGNPAGTGWNYLQGLGITNIELLDNDLFGQTGIAGHSLANPAFSLFVVTAGGGLEPFTDATLTAGTAHTFEILDSAGVPGHYDVAAYSGQSNAGAYGGGMLTSIMTGADGKFNYTPTTGTPPGGHAATTYGYFLVTSVVGPSPEWSFVDYAVAAPTPAGPLTLCVVDPYGNCDTANAETTMFTTTTVGDYNIMAQAETWVNGLPAAGAVVTQVAAANLEEGVIDPTLPPADYAAGATIGSSISDARGEATFWPAALGLAETDGPLYTQVYFLTATYDGLVSNTVTVYVEPQSGSFYTGNLSLNSGGTAVVGNLSFAGMKYASFVNISAGGGPGQFDNYTCPLPGGAPQPAGTMLLPGCTPFYDTNFGADVWESGVDDGVLPVNLDVTGLTGPIVVSELADGVNDVSFGESEYFDGFYYNFTEQSVQNPIVWQDPTVFLPATIAQSAAGNAITGTDTISWSGASYLNAQGVEIATGTLSLVSGAGTTVLSTGISGSFSLNTATLPDGSYSVVFTETAPGAATTTRTVSFYADNEVAALTTQVDALSAQIGGLEKNWAAANASVASELSADLATIASLQAQLSVLQSSSSADQSQITQLQSELSADAAQIAQVQAELNQKHTAAAPWYAAYGGAGIVGLLVGTILVALVAGYVYGRRRTERGHPETPGRTGEPQTPPGRTSGEGADAEPIPSWPNLRVPPGDNEPPRRNGIMATPQTPAVGRPHEGLPGDWSRPPN
jgi:subtilase family serine protease